MGVTELSRLVAEALYLALLVSAPALVVALVVGLVQGVLSAATQVQEHSLSYVPKAAAVFLTLALSGGWMATQLVEFTDQLYRAIPSLVG